MSDNDLWHDGAPVYCDEDGRRYGTGPQLVAEVARLRPIATAARRLARAEDDYRAAVTGGQRTAMDAAHAARLVARDGLRAALAGRGEKGAGDGRE